MKTRIVVSIILFLALMAGCHVEENLGVEDAILIEGNEICTFMPEYDESRTDVEGNLSSNSQLSFYSSGAFECNGEVLTFDGTEWKGDTDFFWQKSVGPVRVQAYVPKLNSGTSDFYDYNNCLKEIFHAQGEFEVGSKIILNFTHLFPEIVFKLSESINATVSQIKFKVSKKLVGMDDMLAAHPILVDNTTDYIIFEKASDATYHFLLPYSEQQLSIEVVVVDTAGKLRKTSLEKVFRQGVSYRCTITEDAEPSHGIYTKQDFIDFIALYNGGKVKNKTLDDFYDLEEGRRIFRLRNSLDFSSEESVLIKSINCNTDIFDGMGHTLSGITFSNISKGECALFSRNEGEIRNLIIDKMSITLNGKASASQFTFANLCYFNSGYIHNCMLTNSEVTMVAQSKQYLTSSFLAHYNDARGIIYNCGVESCKTNATKSGGLVFTNDGLLLNNYVYDCSMVQGGHLCYFNNENLYSSYSFIKNPNTQNKDVTALFYTYSKTAGLVRTIDCFRQNEYGEGNIIQQNISCFSYDSKQFDSVSMKYHSNAAEYEGTLSGALNYCVDNKRYVGDNVQIELAKWVSAADGHPIFEYYNNTLN